MVQVITSSPLGSDISTSEIQDDAVTAAKLAIPTTKGNILVGNDTIPTELTVGTNNQVLVADSAQATGIKWGATPSGTEFVASGGGVIETTGTATIDTHAFSSADLAAGDMLSLRIFYFHVGGSASSFLRIKKDTTTIHSVDAIAANEIGFIEIILSQDQSDNTFSHVFRNQVGGTTVTNKSDRADMTDTNWITGAWTLELQGEVANAADDLHVKWIVTKIKSA